VGAFSTPAVDQDAGGADEGYRQAGSKRRDPEDFDASGDLLDRSCHTHPALLDGQLVAAQDDSNG
jgi:hypothetical protein